MLLDDGDLLLMPEGANPVQHRRQQLVVDQVKGVLAEIESVKHLLKLGAVAVECLG